MICFDATGTLIETATSVGEVYRRVALEHGVDLPAWRLDDAFRRVLRHAPARGLVGATRVERCAGEVDWWFERVRQTFQATDSTVRFEDFRGFARALFDLYGTGECWQARPGIPELLAFLDAQGAFLSVVSNFDHRLPDILEALDLKKFFRVVSIPCESGHAKPDRIAFEAVARAARRPIESLVYLGDDPPEVLATIAAHGLRVFDVRALRPDESLADLLLDASQGTSPVAPAATLPVSNSETPKT